MFSAPRKFILTQAQLEWFQTSATHQAIVAYIETLNASVVGVRLTDACEESEVTVAYYEWTLLTPFQHVGSVLRILDAVEQLCKDTPPVHNAASRFGNPAFRTLYDKIREVRSPAFFFLFLTIGLVGIASSARDT